MSYLQCMKNRTHFILAILSILFINTVIAQSSPNYEFRGVWIATVENIDWPAKKNLSVSEQKASFTRLLDLHQYNGMIEIVKQFRPNLRRSI